MAPERDPMKRWERIMVELHELAAERRALDRPDEHILAKFQAGIASEEEQQAVRIAMEASEDTRLLMDVLDDVYKTPELLRPDPARGTRPNLIWAASDKFWTLTGQLSAWVDEQGKVVASGFRELIRAPQLGTLESRPGVTKQRATWKLPILDGEGALEVGLVPSDSPGVWLVAGRIETVENPRFIVESQLEIRSPDGTIEFASSVDQWISTPISLTAGVWELRISWQLQVWQLSLSIGDVLHSED